ncbi:Ca2+-transporting ATPase [Albidovulum inexpectatum]|uniref:Ca2+-transporting ATPase n=1 Tax=Albidovulum inexpectatum TaxID=196587 RepID=A0A2S5JFY8_9RHOB|nr:cation-transporting P-type ATPase [Albidovulum inexpectatum]PPB80426.1 Ca2+-transporting ATPase [Albidovulum inexpectatum]
MQDDKRLRPDSRSQGDGLEPDEVRRRLARFGPNEIGQTVSVAPHRVLARQFASPLVLLLLGAAVIAGLLGEIVDMAAILLVVGLNAILGFVQEWRAETAIAALRGMLAPRARVRRAGQEAVVPARDLVPGDVVLVEAGDRVPADLRLILASGLRIDESVLTGESVAVDKSLDPGEEHLFMGTLVVAGRGEAVVEATGARTRLGQIAGMTQAVAGRSTVLSQRLARLARQIGLVAVMVACAVVLLGLWRGESLTVMGITALSLAVAAVPEGLPAVVTVTLALGASAMARRKALVRRLQAVETLGSASVICTDKTGTLTENRMTARIIRTPEALYEVTGSGHDPAGHIARAGRRVRASDDPGLAALLEAAIGCNNARLVRQGDDWQMVGEPTEGALVVLAYKGWVAPDAPGPRELEIPFDSDRKMMSVIVRVATGRRLLTKGAPESVIPRCDRLRHGARVLPMDRDARDDIARQYDDMAAQGLRVLALAERDLPGLTDDPEQNLTFLGLVGLIDPPRPEVPAAISEARGAGIGIVMITGDAPNTARAIARAVGLSAKPVITGAELENMDDSALRVALGGEPVFARTAPEQKMRIVAVLQAMGHVVAMTGDGVNDAPALKAADIGIAMGQRGTDVAREAADLVLLDDNFATIVAAIEEGRRQFANLRKFVLYLFSANLGEVLAIMGNLAIGAPLMLLATQILWMNLVTDGAVALALGAERAEPGQMRQKPRPRDAALIGREGFVILVLFGLYVAAAGMAAFQIGLQQGLEHARGMAFGAIVMVQVLGVFGFRSLAVPCTRLGWLSNPALVVAVLATLAVQAMAFHWAPLSALLHARALGVGDWAILVALALPGLFLPEMAKTLWRERHLGAA